MSDYGFAMGEGVFAGMRAPSGRGEAIERRVVSYSTPPAGADQRQARLAARFIIGASLSPRDARRERQAVMAQARAAETERRTALRQAVETETETEGESIDGAASDAADVSEYRGVSLATLTALADDRPAWPVARRIAARFERAVARLDSERREWVALAAAEPSNDGRGNGWEGYARGTVVNGRETRMAPRWQGTPRRAVTLGNGTAIDWQAYSIVNGVRTAFTPSETETKPRAYSKPISAALAQAAALRAIAASGTAATHDYSAQ